MVSSHRRRRQPPLYRRLLDLVKSTWTGVKTALGMYRGPALFLGFCSLVSISTDGLLINELMQLFV